MRRAAACRVARTAFSTCWALRHASSAAAVAVEAAEASAAGAAVEAASPAAVASAEAGAEAVAASDDPPQKYLHTMIEGPGIRAPSPCLREQFHHSGRYPDMEEHSILEKGFARS